MTGLPDELDAYGHALWDHLTGTREGYEIVERDDGYIAASGGPPFYFGDLDDWPPAERQALRYVRGRVLDVGAGAGRVSLELQERGHDVVTIDNSPLAVKVCRRRGVVDARVMSFTQIDASLGPIDTVVMFGNNFGLFATPKRARWLLRRLRNLTTDGGRIVAASMDPYASADPDHRRYHRLNRQRGRLPGELRLKVRYRSYATPFFGYLIVSEAEMRTILKGTGWEITRVVRSAQDIPGYYVAVIDKLT